MDGIMDIDGHHPTKWIVTKQMGQNIITTLRGTYILEVEEWCNDDDEDTYVNNDGGDAPNDNDYHEPQPQDTNPIIGCASTSIITRASQSHIVWKG
jgi:hypothetical protein